MPKGPQCVQGPLSTPTGIFSTISTLLLLDVYSLLRLLNDNRNAAGETAQGHVEKKILFCPFHTRHLLNHVAQNTT